ALVTIDAEALPNWLKGKGLPDMTVEEASKHEVAREHIDRAVARANKVASRAESIRRWDIVLEAFTVANGYLTPSMKLKRALVMADYADAVDALYASAPAGD